MSKCDRTEETIYTSSMPQRVNVHHREPFSALEKAPMTVTTPIDNRTSLFDEYSKDAHDSDANSLTAMQTGYGSSLESHNGLRASATITTNKAGRSEQKIEQVTSRISRPPSDYGITLLPDEMLSGIFVLAATTLEEKVAIALVCKRFRSVMMSMRKMWSGYWIESSQSPEQIIAIAEGHKFVSLKARIRWPSPLPSCIKAWVDERRLDLAEYRMRYYKFLLVLILSLGLEELECDYLTASVWKGIEPILAGGNMKNLRGLVMREVSRNPVGERLLESWHMPLLQNLEVGFMPGAALARNLTRCSLCDIRVTEFDSLREFLAAAKPLQDLTLYLSDARSRFCEVCDLPSLRSLTVNFVPHPSLARCLIRVRFSFPYGVRLTELPDFLSSSGMLQKLTFDACPDTTSALPVVTIPSVVSCEIHQIGPALVAKLRMPALRTLKLDLRGLDKLTTIARNEFRSSLQSMTSLDDLELLLMESEVAVADLDEVIRYAPLHLKSFSLKGCRFFVTRVPRRNVTPAPSRNLVQFKDCYYLEGDFMFDFVGHLRAVGLGNVKIQFDSCAGWMNGVLNLDEVMLVGGVRRSGMLAE